ncbi:hypothetical protein D9M68_835560 [compost metagenome]
MQPGLRVFLGEIGDFFGSAAGVAPHAEGGLAVGAQLVVAGVDQALAQAELLLQLQFVVDWRHTEHRGMDRRFIDDVLGRLRRHGVGARHAPGRLVGFQGQYFQAGLREVAG